MRPPFCLCPRIPRYFFRLYLVRITSKEVGDKFFPELTGKMTWLLQIRSFTFVPVTACASAVQESLRTFPVCARVTKIKAALFDSLMPQQPQDGSRQDRKFSE